MVRLAIKVLFKSYRITPFTKLESLFKLVCALSAGAGARMVGALMQENFWRPQIFAPVFYLICFAFARYDEKKNYV